MRNILLIGLGRFGRYTAMKMNELGQQVMAVDKNEERVNKVLNYVTNAQIGDGTSEDFLRSLGVTNYDVCIVAIGDDFLASLETTACLKDLGAKYVIARAAGKSQEKFLLRNGADEVVFPERQLAIWTAIHCCSASLSNYIELSDGYSLFDIHIPKQWVGKTVRELELRKKFGVNILGIKENGIMNMHVNADTELHEDMSLLALGREEELAKFIKLG